MNLRRRPELWVMAAYSVFYIALIFPFAYFRHDDWQIISNSVLRLPDDWRFLFTDTLYDLGVPTRWFVRPVFKALAFVSYPVFGLWYFGWLLEVLAINLAAIWLTCKTLRDLGRGDGAVLIFAIVFCASLHWHLGTQAWIGAGLINAPQLLGCALSLWAFCRFAMSAARGPAAASLALAIAGYALALGAKESSVLHAALLAIICWRITPLRHTPPARRLVGLTAIALVTATYLALRLSVPLNRDYEPTIEGAVAADVTVLVASLAVSTVALLWALRPLLTATQRWAGAVFLWPFAVLAGVSMTPYIGHPFFSTNWFFYTGYVWALALALWGGTTFDIGTAVWPRRAITAFALVSVLPVMIWLTGSGWWQWQRGERQAVEVLRAADATRITRVLVHDCEATESRTRLARVIGTDVHLYDLWLLLHRTPATIEVTTCNAGETASADADPHTLRLRWVFPNLSAF